MQRKSEIEMERARVIKITRTLTRLKHTLAYDEEINEVLPDKLNEFDAAIQEGELKTLTADIDVTIGELQKLLSES